jgi:hypothetical protein
MDINILENDDAFLKYQLDHYFKNYINIEKKFSYIDAVNDYISYVSIKNKVCPNFFWLEVIHSDGKIDIYFRENSNIENIMSNKNLIMNHYNLEIIKNQTLLIASSIKNFPFFVIRSGWDMCYINIDQPCLLRTSRREENDFGVIIPDSSTQSLRNLNKFKNSFGDINFKEKKNTLIWRGSYTGLVSKNNNEIWDYIDKENKVLKFKFYSRWNFVNKFCNNYNIKMVVTNHPSMSDNEKKITKNMSTYNNLDATIMAKNYKFQIALNGNSFAGSFGWNLLSKSVVFHPDYENNFYTYIYPRKNIDYVSIKDNYEDLNDKINYFIKNENESEIIAENGKKYIDKLINLSKILTENTMNKIYELYDQNTMNDAVNIMNEKLTKVSVKFKNNNFQII